MNMSKGPITVIELGLNEDSLKTKSKSKGPLLHHGDVVIELVMGPWLGFNHLSLNRM